MKKGKFLFKAFVFVAIIFIVFVTNVSADENEKKRCLICSGDPDVYDKEQQFAERVRIFKNILGNSIDEVALAATVVHKESAFSAVESRYDTNFDKTGYTNSIRGLYGTSNLTESKSFDSNSGLAGGRVDLLNAAAIVMANSAGWGGSYNEEKYQEALAGDGLISDNEIANFIFCQAGAAADGIFSMGNIAYQFATGADVEAEIRRSQERWHNMTNICENGYIGGVYNITEKTVPNPEVRKAKKQAIAKEIIDLIHTYRELAKSEAKDNCSVTTSGDFSAWKQYDDEWKLVPVGNSGENIWGIGCTVTSTAIQMARSGTQISNLPNGSTSFNPGIFVKTLNQHGGFTSGGGFTWSGFQSIAPNWKIVPNVGNLDTGSTADLAKKLSRELSEKAEGKYQKYIVLQISHSGSNEHWVAVDSVTDNSVTIFDPGARGTTLDENYSGWHAHSYSVMYGTDTEGGSGNGSVNSCGGGGDVVQQIKEFIRNGEGMGTCNYHGQGEDTGYQAYVIGADMSYVGWSTGYGFTELYMKDYADRVGYTTFLQDGANGCTSKEYVDKMADLKFSENYDLVKKLYDEKSGGKTLKNNQYVALIYKYNHWPVKIAEIIDALVKVDPYSYEAFSIFMQYNGLGGSCGGFNGSELLYHVWYNGNLKAVRDYPCASPSRDYWEKRVQFYKTEKIDSLSNSVGK